jgi:DNA-binding GntR family transcriptional regulator
MELAGSGPAGPGHHATRLARSVYSGRIAVALRQAIIEGELPVGMQLVETQLAEQLAVSRGPIRNALNVLEGEGLVETMPNGRMAVVGFDQDDLRDLFAVRYELESTAIRWGLEQTCDLASVESAMIQIAKEASFTPRLVDLDIEFHRALVEMPGSRFLVRSWLALAPVIHAVITIGNRRLAVTDPERNINNHIDPHKALVEAMRESDVERAQTVLAGQFAFARETFSELVTASKGTA